MKNLFFFIYWFALLACKPLQNEHQSAYFKIESASQQAWTGGAAGSGSGINYAIKIWYTGHTDFKIETVWIDGREYSPEMREFGKEGIIEGVDILCNYKTWVNPATGIYSELPEKAKDIPKYEGAALMKYSVDGKEHFFIIDRFQKLEPLNYP